MSPASLLRCFKMWRPPEVLHWYDAVLRPVAFFKGGAIFFTAYSLFDHFNGWVDWRSVARMRSWAILLWQGEAVGIWGLYQVERFYVSLNVVEIYWVTLQIFSACHMMLILDTMFVLLAWITQVMVLLVLVMLEDVFFNYRIQFSLLFQILFKSISKF